MNEQSRRDSWEYSTELLYANADDAKEFLRERWPNWKPAKYSPQALMPVLNQRGSQGWELVSLVPVDVGKDGAVFFRGADWASIRTHISA